MRDDSRCSYFLLRLDILPEYLAHDVLKESVENKIHLILNHMKANDEVYRFQEDRAIICLFKTDLRKRKGELDKYVRKEFLKSNESVIDNYQTIPLLRKEYTEFLENYKRETNMELVSSPINIKLDYDGDDVEIFTHKRNWHPWQKEIFNEMFEPSGTIKPSNQREINFIYDPRGKCGKSSFLKWLYTNNPDQIAKISFGNSSQLRSAIINMGENKRIYFVDLPRSKEKYSSNSDLLNSLEDLKNGFLTSPMYGKDNALVIKPPHIIVFSNYIFENTGLSVDRWMIREVTKDMTLKNITDKILNQEEFVNVEKK